MVVFRLMDTKAVINEVRTRECLWNPGNVHYKNKTEKFKAWNEVSEAVVPKYANCPEDEKQRISRAVQSRWKTARDAYMKCRLIEGKKPTYKSRQHKYIYQEQLTFLEQVKDDEENSYNCVGENTASQSTFAVSDDDGAASDEIMDFDIDIHDDFKEKIQNVVTAIEGVSDKAGDIGQEILGTSSQNEDQNDPLATKDVHIEPRTRPHSAKTRKIKSNMSEFETRLLKIMRMKNNTNESNSALQADDQHFFNSLAPLINNFDIHQKLTFRSKILEVVMQVGKIGSEKVKQEKETYVFEESGDP